jgi:gamma-glutamyltranspeptidase/glutathione hydrolase
VLNVVLNVTAWGMTGRAAVDAPRAHHQWLPDRLTVENAPDELVAGLRALGHQVTTTNRQGSAQTIWIDPKTREAYGVADARDSTAKASAAVRR